MANWGTQGVLAKEIKDCDCVKESIFSCGVWLVFPGTRTPFSAGVLSARLTMPAVVMAMTAGGRATLLHPDHSSRAAARAVPPSPPE